MDKLTLIIKEWFSTHYGLVVSEERIQSGILKLLSRYELNEADYLQAIKTKQTPIVNATVEALTVQESYFFRDISLFYYLKNILLPNLIKEKQNNNDYKLTIWSAGCAYGEEIYSVAIYLDQLLPNLDEWDINLIATDINEAALEEGRKGRFTQSSMRATDEVTIREYFEFYAPFYVLKPRIREMVQFTYYNIAKMDKSFEKNSSVLAKSLSQKCDFILCRNVFIYLNQTIIESALHYFYDCLVDEGILFLGPTDLITYYRHSFTLEIVANLYLLRKTKQKKVHDNFNTDANPISKKVPLTYFQQLQEKTHKLKEIGLLLDHKNYKEVLEKTDAYLATYSETALLLRYKGEALIGLGDTETALLFLNKSIQRDPLDAISHFLHGMVELDKKNHRTAMESLQKALYLKTNFPEAAYYLSLLYLQNKQEGRGMKLLRQALIYAQEQPKENSVLGANGSMTEFIQAIQASISFYQGKHYG